ncbi:MAG: xanthine dehydrogenase small subunit [Pseudomonadota bacterium]|jgi:xanthine dehydrogenase small subunit
MPDPAQPLRLFHRGAVVSLAGVPPTRTLLALLREDLGLKAVKEGCNSGDCGACAVVLAELDGPRLRWRASNSCIRLAHSIDGMAVWTAADLASDPLLELDGAALHPVQQALVDAHGSQCGFCTPGIVMSLFALQQQSGPQAGPPSRTQVERALSGNLCRCTGYRPVLDAAQAMGALPQARVDEVTLAARLREIPQASGLDDGCAETQDAALPPCHLAPRTLAQALRIRSRWPEAHPVAGGTDFVPGIHQGLQSHERLLDLTRVQELRRIECSGGLLSIGAGVTLDDAFAALQAHWPGLDDYLARFAGAPVRQTGTLGGNVANGSPVGDGLPPLIALRAQLVLARLDAASGAVCERRVAVEDFYSGYRSKRLEADELLATIEIPLPGRPPLDRAGQSGHWTRAYKVSRRQEDDISALSLALSLQLSQGRVQAASLGVGGMAATPMRARQTEAALAGQAWNADTARAAMSVLEQEFDPLSDQRASAAYRRRALAHLLWRSWLESQSEALPFATGLAGLEPIAVPAGAREART